MIDSPICKEWAEIRNKHPMYGEKLNDNQIVQIWDSAYETYTDTTYRDVKDSIIEYLVKSGVFSKDRTLLDIGSGPGFYALYIAKYLREITCMDPSQGMLDRLMKSCEEMNISNIQPLKMEWGSFDTNSGYDIAFASLCPPLNRPEEILRMEKYSREYCVYISTSDIAPGMQIEIWNELGKDYSYAGSDIRFPYEFLKELGREPILKTFEQNIDGSTPYEQAVSSMIRTISKYIKIDDDVEKTVRKIISGHTINGMVINKSVTRMGLLVWKP